MCRLLCVMWKYRSGQGITFIQHMYNMLAVASLNSYHAHCSLWMIIVANESCLRNHTGWALALATTDLLTVWPQLYFQLSCALNCLQMRNLSWHSASPATAPELVLSMLRACCMHISASCKQDCSSVMYATASDTKQQSVGKFEIDRWSARLASCM